MKDRLRHSLQIDLLLSKSRKYVTTEPNTSFETQCFITQKIVLFCTILDALASSSVRLMSDVVLSVNFMKLALKTSETSLFKPFGNVSLSLLTLFAALWTSQVL